MKIERPQEYNVKLEEKEESIITKCILLLDEIRDEVYDHDCTELVCRDKVITFNTLEDVIDCLSAISEIEKIKFNYL